MAIALDVASNSGAQTASPFSWSHTVTGANLLMVVMVDLTNSSSLQPTTTGVTCNGVAMVKARGDQGSNGVNFVESSIWFLFAPTTGTIQVTASNVTNAFATAVSYTGAQQSNTPDAVNGGAGTTNTANTTVTTVANNCWVVCTACGWDRFRTAITGDKTERAKALIGGGASGGVAGGEDSNGPQAIGAYAIGWSETSSGSGMLPSVVSAASFAQASAPANYSTAWLRG